MREAAGNTGHFTVGGDGSFSLTASIGTVSNSGSGTWSWSFPTNDGPDQTQTVTVTATDSDGNSASTAFALTVRNVPPSVALTNTMVTTEAGQTAANNGSWNDPGLDVVTLSSSIGTIIENSNHTWDWSYDTGHGPVDISIVTITATDSDGDSSATSFTLKVVDTTPPVITAANITAEATGAAGAAVDLYRDGP